MMLPSTLTLTAAGAGLACLHPAVRAELDNQLAAFNRMAAEHEPWKVAAGAVVAYLVTSKAYEFFFVSEGTIFERTKAGVFSTLRKIPLYTNEVAKEVEKTMPGFERSLIKHNKDRQLVKTLPSKGMGVKEVEKMLTLTMTIGDPEARRKNGKMSGTIYVGGNHFEEYTQLLTKAYGMYAWSNPLHATVFPGVRQMEAEIISMCVGIFGGKGDECGCHTSGGTESIIMAIKAYRDYAREKHGITRPNIVAPRTAHPAFDKGCQYFGVALRKVQEDPVTRKADVAAMRRAMDSNTVCLVGSCPQYPHGSVDPIVDLGKLAKSAGVGLHVDCCLGSFIVPFMREAGFEFPDFDFSVEGVTSISADTHKFGFAPKGSSVVLYKTKELRRAQYAVFPDWPGGVYGTPCMSGSRPGALVAATWAALVYNGRAGYVESCRKIVSASYRLAEEIPKIPGLKLVCQPQGPIVSWTSDVFDVNRMIDGLIEERGWDINVLQFPASMHICCTSMHAEPGTIERLLKDMREVVEPLMKNPNVKVAGAGAVYGTAQSIPDRSIIQDVVRGFIDVTYQTDFERQ